MTNAINKTKELVEIEISKFDEAQKWLIHAFRYDTIKKNFLKNMRISYMQINNIQDGGISRREYVRSEANGYKKPSPI